jgi:hypothetical protein
VAVPAARRRRAPGRAGDALSASTRAGGTSGRSRTRCTRRSRPSATPTPR